jgi:hypothetical protein
MESSAFLSEECQHMGGGRSNCQGTATHGRHTRNNNVSHTDGITPSLCQLFAMGVESTTVLVSRHLHCTR